MARLPVERHSEYYILQVNRGQQMFLFLPKSGKENYKYPKSPTFLDLNVKKTDKLGTLICIHNPLHRHQLAYFTFRSVKSPLILGYFKI